MEVHCGEGFEDCGPNETDIFVFSLSCFLKFKVSLFIIYLFVQFLSPFSLCNSLKVANKKNHNKYH